MLDYAQVLVGQSTRTFRHLFAEHVERPFADKYIEQLLATDDVTKDNVRITALFAKHSVPTLRQAGLLGKELPESWLLLTYCVYWWQNFAKGYAFEVEIMRDLATSDIDFQMHDLRNPLERYSPADLTVLGKWGDIKTSTYFLHLSLIDGYIERSSQEYGEMPASVFFEFLFKRMAQGATETIELEVEIVDDKLVLQPPIGAVQVTNNEILIGDRRIVVKLKDKPIYPTAR